MGGLVGGGKPDNSAALESLRLQREQAETARKQAEEQKRQYAEDLSAKRRARRAGGKRGLLAEGRFSPELGVTDEEQQQQDTLGAV